MKKTSEGISISWLLVVVGWIFCIVITMAVIQKEKKTRDIKSESPAQAILEETEQEKNQVPHQDARSGIMVIGSLGETEKEDPFETESIGESPMDFSEETEAVYNMTEEMKVETDSVIVFQPETHVVPIPEIKAPKNDATEETIVETDSDFSEKESTEAESTEAETTKESMTEPENTEKRRMEAGGNREQETASPASFPVSMGDGTGMDLYSYRFSQYNGTVIYENYDDSFYISFHRTSSGETMSFDYITYDKRWIDALSAAYPEEDPDHAAGMKERFPESGTVYSYRVSDFRNGISYISIFPDDRIVIVEEGGKNGIRYYTAGEYHAELLPVP